MRFSEIPGNQEIKQKLIQSVKTGRVSHTQLFLGEDGSASFPWRGHMRNIFHVKIKQRRLLRQLLFMFEVRKNGSP